MTDESTPRLGPTRVVIEEVPHEKRELEIGGQTVTRGEPLSSLVASLGGYVGEVTRPSTGERFQVSLEPWKDRDPETTFLAIAFINDLDLGA